MPIANSLIGIWPVVALEDHAWPVGPLTRRLQALIEADDARQA